MNNILIAIVGEDRDVEEVLYKSFREFFPHILVLLVKRKYEKKAQKIEKKLQQFDFTIRHDELSNEPSLEEVFMKVNFITKLYLENTISINVDTDYMTSCLALSSAFVNGIQAIGILNEKIIAYPIMQFSYYHALNEKKLEILQCVLKYKRISLNELGKELDMKLPLLAYHLRGDKDSKGLEKLQLINLIKEEQTTFITLSELGRLIANGYVN